MRWCVHYTLYGLIMKCFDVVYLTEGIGLDQNDSIFTGKLKKDSLPTNNFLLQSSISGSIKILSPFFLYGCLWLLGREEITVIQMLSDFSTPVNIRQERTTPSSTMPRKKKDETSVLNILSTYLCSISSQAITSAESRLLDTYRTLNCVSLH